MKPIVDEHFCDIHSTHFVFELKLVVEYALMQTGSVVGQMIVFIERGFDVVGIENRHFCYLFNSFWSK